MTESNPGKIELEIEEKFYLEALILKDKKNSCLIGTELTWRENLIRKIMGRRSLDQDIEAGMQFNDHDIDRNKRSNERKRDSIKPPPQWANPNRRK